MFKKKLQTYMQKMYQQREEENKFPNLKIMIANKHEVKHQMPRKQV